MKKIIKVTEGEQVPDNAEFLRSIWELNEIGPDVEVFYFLVSVEDTDKKSDFDYDSFWKRLVEPYVKDKLEQTEKRWNPVIGDAYWYVTDYGVCNVSWWKNNAEDGLRYKIGNCYKTEEEAEQALSRVTQAYHD